MIPRCVVVLASLAACGRIDFEPADASLASITLWATPTAQLADPLSPGFDPATTTYAVDVGLTMQAVLISATPVDPDKTITIENVDTAAGAQSPPRALDLGTNTIVVVGTSRVGARAIYHVDVTRAAGLGADGYLKASNAEMRDFFGRAVAIDGDTLVVGAPGEASSATGVDGDQADNSAIDAGAAYVFVRTNDVWSQQAYLKASNTETLDAFGTTVAISGDTIAVTSFAESSDATGIDGDQTNNNAPGSGAVYVFARTGTTWAQQAYVKASNTGANDEFGLSLGLDGDTLAVGAPTENSASTGIDGDETNAGAAQSGAVYVFTRAAATWSQQAYVKASNTNAGDVFGQQVALSGDTLAVGAPNEESAATGIDGLQSDNSAVLAGAVYVFTRVSATWSQQAYIKASNTRAQGLFGGALALWGDTLVVGSSGETSASTGIDGDQTDTSAFGAGAAYIFVRAGTTWAQQAYVKASNAHAEDNFGYVVGLSGDTLAFSAPQESSDATGIDGDQTDQSLFGAGAAYVFTRTGSTWSQQAYLKQPVPKTNEFGLALAISGRHDRRRDRGRSEWSDRRRWRSDRHQRATGRRDLRVPLAHGTVRPCRASSCPKIASIPRSARRSSTATPTSSPRSRPRSPRIRSSSSG